MRRNKVRGLERLKRQIAALPNSVRATLHDEMAGAAKDMAGAIERAVPGDMQRLKGAVGWSEGPAPKSRSSGVLSSTSADFARSQTGQALSDAGLLFSVYVGNDEVFWPRWVEFGTAPHSLAKGADRTSKAKDKKRLQATGPQHPGARAQPFFYPTVRAWKKPLKSRVRRAATKAAKAVAALK